MSIGPDGWFTVGMSAIAYFAGYYSRAMLVPKKPEKFLVSDKRVSEHEQQIAELYKRYGELHARVWTVLKRKEGQAATRAVKSRRRAKK